jgi:hypothetical protein
LVEILPVGRLEGIRVDHLEKNPFVARQPLTEDASRSRSGMALISLAETGGNRLEVRRKHTGRIMGV